MRCEIHHINRLPTAAPEYEPTGEGAIRGHIHPSTLNYPLPQLETQTKL